MVAQLNYESWRLLFALGIFAVRNWFESRCTYLGFPYLTLIYLNNFDFFFLLLGIVKLSKGPNLSGMWPILAMFFHLLFCLFWFICFACHRSSVHVTTRCDG